MSTTRATGTPWHQLLFGVERLPKVPSPGCLYQIQFLAYFLAEFIPTNSTSLQTFSYFENLPSHHGRSAFIDIGSTALSLVYLGQVHGDNHLVHLSLRYYQLLLEGVRRKMAKPPTEDVIICAAILSMYEVYDSFRVYNPYPCLDILLGLPSTPTIFMVDSCACRVQPYCDSCTRHPC